MSNRSTTVLFLLLAFCAAPLGAWLEAKPNPQADPSRKVLLISFDGFRADYLEKADTPNLDRFVAEGVRAEAMTPVFPVKTFPNHYAIATGLRPIHSGLVGNTMFDKSTGEWYRISDRGAVQNPAWYSGEPIWNTVEKAGLTAGSYFWVGSEAPVGGMQPTYWKVYDGSVGNESRIDSMIHWMTRTDGPQIDFGLLYFSDVDSYGHEYDPDSDSVRVIIQRADALVGYVMRGLETAGLVDRTDVVIVSDHGMAGYAADRIIVLDEAVDPRKVQLVETGPILSMNLAPGTDATDRDALLARLRSHSKADHFDVFLHDELPSGYQFGDSPRATDVYLVPEAGYVILPERSVEFFTASLPAGGHGYWPTDSVMKASFFAHGPSIAQGKVIPEFPNVNVYGLICRLLGIHPAPNDGDPEWPAQVLR